MRSTLATASIALALLGVLLTAGSCSVDGYCLDCYDANNGGTVFDANNGGNFDADLRDGGGDFDACVPSGIEQCDDLDNDCDGQVDEADDGLPGVGVSCGTDVGECVAGTTICQDGSIVCGEGAVNATFELCNTLDDDCDGSADENNPEGGLVCGTNQGECQAGITQCSGGALSCVGQVTGGSEICNGLDDDCDGLFDEGITLSGNCGPASDDGVCTFGVNTCVGGSIQCVGAVLPQLEQCDMTDHDCDGNNLNGFNLATDPNNCTACGNQCTGGNAFWSCNNGCEVAACESTFFDLNNSPADGCEFGPCTFAGNEICNGADDDCDGLIDEGVNTNPALLCDQDGECNGAVAVCDSAAGRFVCDYGATVTTDVDGNIIPEGDCDERDNDCDGRTDEAFLSTGPISKGKVCSDGEIGQCRDTGTHVCNATDDGLVCTAVDVLNPGNAPAESCNNLDDDCDGSVDEIAGGDLQEWVAIGGGVEIFKYEASRPDSTSTEQGFVLDQSVCSEANRIPWTNITQPQAEAVCANLGGGARLCTEDEWLNACETDNIGPGVQEGPLGLIVFEAEDTSISTIVPGSSATWEVATARPGFSGTSAIVVPDNTQGAEFDNSNLSNSPRIDYALNFEQTGTHFLWVRLLSDNNGDDSFWVAFDDTDANIPGLTFFDSNDHDEWLWFTNYQDGARASFNVTTIGAHTLSFYHGEDGVLIDKVIMTTDPNYVPQGPGDSEQCTWSYGSDCRTYATDTCNGEDFDPDGNAANGDQDIMLATGSRAACFAEWEAGGDAFDLSGNVKEWTAERAPGINPLRGGSFNNTEVGISCQFDFLTADDNFFLPNIGFRCCR